MDVTVSLLPVQPGLQACFIAAATLLKLISLSVSVSLSLSEYWSDCVCGCVIKSEKVSIQQTGSGICRVKTTRNIV